jgi:hypothetical protein
MSQVQGNECQGKQETQEQDLKFQHRQLLLCQDVLQFHIPEGVDQATANLLNMQMNMMQTLMAQME